MERKNCIWLVLGAFVLVRAYIFLTTYHLPGWDESVYLAMGKYFWSAGRIGLFELLRPPALPFLLGFFWRIGMPYIFAADMVIAFFALATIYLTYLVAKELYSVRVAVFAAALLALTPIFFQQSLMVLTEIPSACLGMLALYLFIKKSYFMSGVAVAFGFLMRYHMGLMLPVIGLVILLGKNDIVPKLIRLGLGFGVIMLPMLCANLVFFGNPLVPYIVASGYQFNSVYGVGGFLANLLFYFGELIKSNILYILLIPAFLCMARKRWKKELVVPALLFYFYLTFVQNKQLRFVLVVLPVFAILSAYGIECLMKTRWQIKALLVLLVVIGVAQGYTINRVYVSVLPREVPEAIETFKQYLFDKEPGKTVLTMNPLPAAFVDVKFITNYDSFEEMVEIYNRDYAHVDAIVVSAEAIVCPDEWCENAKAAILHKMRYGSKFVCGIDYWFTHLEIYYPSGLHE
ncbi:MAG: glycosyltransferase family 39 protein [Candidatus Woesearchaeota archaeon]